LTIDHAKPSQLSRRFLKARDLLKICDAAEAEFSFHSERLPVRMTGVNRTGSLA
jgi:hypothetical protein